MKFEQVYDQLRFGKLSHARLTARNVAIVPSPPGAYLIIINPAGKVTEMKTPICQPQRLVLKLFKA
jgi:hypothetical protein